MNRQPTTRELAGMAWWNSQTEARRAAMLDGLRAAGRPETAAEAWEVFASADKRGRVGRDWWDGEEAMSREPTEEERIGMAWWSGITKPEREVLLEGLRAKGHDATGAEAWRVYGGMADAVEACADEFIRKHGEELDLWYRVGIPVRELAREWAAHVAEGGGRGDIDQAAGDWPARLPNEDQVAAEGRKSRAGDGETWRELNTRRERFTPNTDT